MIMKEVLISTALLAALALIGSFIQALEGYFETSSEEAEGLDEDFPPDLAGDQPRAALGEAQKDHQLETKLSIDPLTL